MKKRNKKEYNFDQDPSGKMMIMKQNAREYYTKNESVMSEERKRIYKSLFKARWGKNYNVQNNGRA